ncbi:MAG: hypothetical protein QXU81_00220 [Candidatus Bathyarchaeia archaeon]
MSRMSSGEKVLFATLIIVVLVLGAHAAGIIDLSKFKQAETIKPAEPTDAVGIFDINVIGYNSLDITSPLSLGTNFVCNVFAYRSGGWLMLGGFANGKTSVELTSQDSGCAYIVVEVPSGQSYYVDWATTKAQNPRVVSVLYEDPDNDGYKEFVFKLDMKNIPKPASGNPAVYFYPYFLQYQRPSINSPPDITGVGTARAVKYIEWYLTFTNEKRAWAISKVEISVNTTDTTKITLSRANIPGVGYLSGDAFGTPVKGTNSLTWTCNIGNNLYSANYIKLGSNQLNKFDFTVQIECQLSAGDRISVTLTIYGFTTTGTLETIADTVVVAA